jgi:hypothetical protein
LEGGISAKLHGVERVQIMRLRWAFVAFVWALFASGLASAQTAFVEGHVFSKRGGIPLSGAAVRVFETVTLGPLPVELAAGITDTNGFYQFEVDQFLGFTAVIEVVCATSRGEIRGEGSALLRAGLIRRDIYLGSRRRLTRCDPIGPESQVD